MAPRRAAGRPPTLAAASARYPRAQIHSLSEGRPCIRVLGSLLLLKQLYPDLLALSAAGDPGAPSQHGAILSKVARRWLLLLIPPSASGYPKA